MPEWLRNVLVEEPTLVESTRRIANAFVLGFVVAGIYRAAQGRRDNQSPGLMATLVLLAIVIAVVTQVIGGDVAMAFSLVGALAIVRFRTVVEDTRDTAFVICAVVVGMACGAGLWKLAVVGIPFVAAAAFLFVALESLEARQPERTRAATLRVRLGVGRAPDERLREAFGKHLESFQLVGTATARQGAAIDLTYRVRLRDDGALGLVADLNATEGVQEVDLRAE